MKNVICYGSDGTILKLLYQWDCNQVIYFTGLPASPLPVFHFCNKNSTEALVVNSEVALGGVSVKVPNILLQEPVPLIIYVYMNTGNDGARTIHALQIPVVPRAVPDDYVYTENTGYITASLVNERLSRVIAQMSGEGPTDDVSAEVFDIRVGYDGSYFATAGDAVRALGQDMQSIREELEGYIDAKAVNGLMYDENYYLYLTSNGEIVGDPVQIIGGGGGGGGGASSVLVLTNQSGWTSTTIADGGSAVISVSWSSTLEDVPTGNGTLKVTVNGNVRENKDVEQGLLSVDVTKYLRSGSNTILINIADFYGKSQTVKYSVSVVSLLLTSTFDSTTVYTDAVQFTYVPVANMEKTVHFILDGSEIGTATVTASGRQQSYTIPMQSHGAHSFRVYFTCDINGTEVRSPELYYDIMFAEEGETATIIAVDNPVTTTQQYETNKINYRVYNPNNLNATVTLKLDNEVLSEQTIDRSTQLWSIRIDVMGEHTLSIVSGGTTKTMTVNVTESDIHVEPETQDLSLYLSSYGRSNNEANPAVWEYGSIAASFSNFNFVSDGWVADDDGYTVCRVAGDARLTIPYKIFATDFRGTGKTIELEFATRDVRNYDSPILSCVSDDRGIVVTSQSVSLKSEQSAISTQFKDEEHVRISFVIEKRSATRLIHCYINGIDSGVVQYPSDDDFSQMNPVDISIGSNDSTIDIYNIRIYDNDLTRYQILGNWIADTQDIDLKLARYLRNDVYDDYNNIVISKLPADLPYFIMEAPELPQYKGDKKIISGSYTNPVDATKSFTYTGAQADVQGTSSQYYERKNYKIKFNGGFVAPNGVASSKYALRGTAKSIPEKTFTFKADVASSEGANNTELAILYNDTCPYKTPGQLRDERVRQCIDGFPIVAFWNDGTATTFIGRYNWNNDKGTEATFGFTEGDESFEILNNTSDRVIWKNDNYVGRDWLNDFEARYPDTDPPYEDPTQLAEFASWVKSTDTTAATDDPLPSPVTYRVKTTEYVEKVDPQTGAITYEEVEVIKDVTYTTDSAEYRLQKFDHELENYVEVDSAYYYYLFTELFLMVDSRAKNAFPSFIGETIE